MPADKRRAIEEEQEIEGFLRQSHISRKNILRLRELCSWGAPGIRAHAVRVLKIALVAPYKRRRSRIIRRCRPDLWQGMNIEDEPDLLDADELDSTEFLIPDNVPPDLDLWEGQDTPESLSGVYDRDDGNHRAVEGAS